eukprot:CAMPEP_0182877142 /NCGR_PEP_ID=MMETSP0034_2-20130328/14575_1 /TAXON_ID=156128 /ORGANISM="Nephroselmis pyriformis, Strain CCMP717" /LENGTH=992 /DNA_ID=CAMNT_0025009971 /DNA_START=61 /DNA_END=3040 /DNA_ORIENTATION=-
MVRIASFGVEAPTSEEEKRRVEDQALLVLTSCREMLYCLELLCGGQHQPIKHLMRHQPQAAVTYDIVAAAALLFEVLQPLISTSLAHDNTAIVAMLNQILRFLQELGQGPCHANQVALAKHSNLLRVCSRILVSETYTSFTGEDNSHAISSIWRSVSAPGRSTSSGTLRRNTSGGRSTDTGAPSEGWEPESWVGAPWYNDLKCALKSNVLRMLLSLLEVVQDFSTPERMSAVLDIRAMVFQVYTINRILEHCREEEEERARRRPAVGPGRARGPRYYPPPALGGESAAARHVNSFLLDGGEGADAGMGAREGLKVAALQEEMLSYFFVLNKLGSFDLEAPPDVPRCSHSGCNKASNANGLCLSHVFCQFPTLQQHFVERTATVEVIVGGEIEFVTFPLTGECQDLLGNEGVVRRLLAEMMKIPRASRVEKRRKLVEVMRLLLFKISLSARTRERHPRPLVRLMKYFNQNQGVFMDTGNVWHYVFYTSLLCMLVLTVSYGRSTQEWEEQTAVVVLTRALCALQVGLCSFLAYLFASQDYPTWVLTRRLMERHERDERSVKTGDEPGSAPAAKGGVGAELTGGAAVSRAELYAAVGSWFGTLTGAASRLETARCWKIWYVSLLLLAALASFASPFFLAVHLTVFFAELDAGQAVFASLRVGGKFIVRTAVLGLIVIVLFGVVTFLAFGEDELYDGGPRPCDSLYQCLVGHMISGIYGDIGVLFVSSSIGIYDPNELPEHPTDDWLRQMRNLMSMLFFVMWTFLLSNIFTGQIVDAFMTMRNKAVADEKDLAERCLVCSIDRHRFHGDGVGGPGQFHSHVTVQHNPLSYLFYLHHILQKDPRDFTVIESTVAAQVTVGRPDWLPLGRALTLERRRGGGDESDENKALEEVRGKMATAWQLDQVQKQVSRLAVMIQQQAPPPAAAGGGDGEAAAAAGALPGGQRSGAFDRSGPSAAASQLRGTSAGGRRRGVGAPRETPLPAPPPQHRARAPARRS